MYIQSIQDYAVYRSYPGGNYGSETKPPKFIYFRYSLPHPNFGVGNDFTEKIGLKKKIKMRVCLKKNLPPGKD